MDSNTWQIIKSSSLFSSLPDATIKAILNNATTTTYEKRKVIFHQGDQVTAFYLVLEGWIKVYRLTPEGDEAVIGVFTTGETFAEAAMFMGGQYPASASTAAKTRLLSIDTKTVGTLLLKDPLLAQAMLTSTSNHMKMLMEQVEQIKLLPGTRKLADFIVKLCGKKKGEYKLELPYEKSLIAGKLGMKPESFSRSLAKLKPLGVKTIQDHLYISNIETLALYAETGQNTGIHLSKGP